MPTFNRITVGVFCRELVCGLEPLSDLLDSWELTEEDYERLRQNEWFQKEVKAAVEDVRNMGPNSTFIMKCRGIAEETLGEVLEIIKNPRADARTRLDAFKLITEQGRLGPPKDAANQGGPSVVFNFGPGLTGIPDVLTVNQTPQQIENKA